MRTDLQSVETPHSWLVATAALVIITFSYGAPMVSAVALKEIAADLGGARSLPAMAGALAWLGVGVGAIGFGLVAERIGYRWTAAFGGVAIAAGMALSAAGGAWHLLVGHAVLIGVLGWGAINVTLMVYVSRWFDRRRGSALAYVTLGQYIAGAIWPSVIALGVQHGGWRWTMLWLGIVSAVVIVPVALAFLSPPPESSAAGGGGPGRGLEPSGFPTATAFALLSIAGFLCCIPMGMPAAHVVAMCTDLGFQPAQGALMLSLLLGSAMLTRQLWGWLSDRIGALPTILAASASQAAAIGGFGLVQDEAGLIAATAAFGMGYSGIIPAYVLAIRQMFPAGEAGWRVPVWYFVNVIGMAMGGWLGGLIFDMTLSYRLAFIVGLAFNVANIALVAWMVVRQRAAKAAP